MRLGCSGCGLVPARSIKVLPCGWHARSAYGWRTILLGGLWRTQRRGAAIESSPREVDYPAPVTSRQHQRKMNMHTSCHPDLSATPRQLIHSDAAVQRKVAQQPAIASCADGLQHRLSDDREITKKSWIVAMLDGCTPFAKNIFEGRSATSLDFQMTLCGPFSEITRRFRGHFAGRSAQSLGFLEDTFCASYQITNTCITTTCKYSNMRNCHFNEREITKVTRSTASEIGE